MAKIAVELEQALARRREDGTPGRMTPQVLAAGEGWTVADVICTAGPQDRPYEEQHTNHSIAIVLTGSFQYRSGLGRELMTPGSLMLGNQGRCFECGHQHGDGDRCVSFWYAPDYFERLAADAAVRGRSVDFTVLRVPPLRPLSSLVARAGAGVLACDEAPWEELAVKLAVRTLRLAAGMRADHNGWPPNAEARVSGVVRSIDRSPDARFSLGAMARMAGLSPYHFLRTFERVTGLTPHQYARRTHLREAATRLLTESGKVVDVALDCGFEDVSNFNRAFRAEFGVSPRAFRAAAR